MSTAEETKLQVRLAHRREAAEIAALWAVCEPDSVWTELGGDLATIYFFRYCTGPHELAVTAWLDGKLAGACVGTGRPRDSARRFYRENARGLAPALVRQAVTRPGVLVVLARRVASGIAGGARAVGRRDAGLANELGSEPRVDPGRTCYMANFFVSPSARGRRLGTLMLERFATEMGERGFDRCLVHTTTDNLASQVAQRRAGFECVARRGRDLTFLRSVAP